MVTSSQWGRAPWGGIPWGGGLPVSGGGGGTQTIAPSGIAPTHAVGSPGVALAGFIIPPSIVRVPAVGRPTIAGPVLAFGIPSSAAVGTPRFNVQQRIKLQVGSPPVGMGIPSSVAFGIPRVALSQSIHPSGIPSSVAFGNATLRGSTKLIRSQGIYQGGVGIPRITGGASALRFYLGGKDCTSKMRLPSNNLTSQAVGRWKLTFTMYDTSGTFLPIVGQTFLVTEGAYKWFAGCIVEVEPDRVPKSLHEVLFQVTALDKTSICDHRIVKQDVYLAGSPIRAAVIGIVGTSLDGEGIRTDGLPSDMGTLEADLKFNYNTVTNGFDQIATLAGMVWWIDVNGVLYFSSLDNLAAAPFSISETTQNWRDMKVKYSLLIGSGYRNVEYAVSNLATTPGGPTRSFTAVLPQQAAVDAGFLFGSLILPFPILQITSLKVNGTPYTAHLGTESINFRHVWWYFPGSPYVIPPNVQNTNACPNPPDSAPDPTVGQTVVIEYVPYGASNADVAVGAALDPSSIVPSGVTPFGALGTCGSGKYESVEQVQNVTSSSDLAAIAAAILARSGGVPMQANYVTDVPGLQVGMLQPFDLAGAFAPGKQLFITQVTGIEQAADMGHGSRFRWSIQGITTRDPFGNWVKFYERLVRRTEQALPVPDFDYETFILAPGGSVAAGASLTNPVPVSRSGLLVELEIAAALAPVDEDLIVTLTRNGAAVASITLAAGSLANFFYTVPVDTAVSPVYLIAKDALNANASYRVVGSSPAPAVSVTMRAKIAV